MEGEGAGGGWEGVGGGWKGVGGGWKGVWGGGKGCLGPNFRPHHHLVSQHQQTPQDYRSAVVVYPKLPRPPCETEKTTADVVFLSNAGACCKRRLVIWRLPHPASLHYFPDIYVPLLVDFLPSSFDPWTPRIL